MDIPTTIVRNGRTYALMGGPRGYYLEQAPTRKGVRGLHVVVWEEHHGRQVPQDHLIHHKDGNSLNNDITNLECVSRTQHQALHPLKDPDRQRRHLARIRPAAAGWHRSDEGRAWHREHAIRVGQREPREYTCNWCAKRFLAKRRAKYCSNQCGYHARRATGRYDVQRVCVICGKSFGTTLPANPGRAAHTCGRVCRGKLNWRNRTGLQPDS